jgi:hypothetical protein
MTTVKENYDFPVLAPNSGDQFWPPKPYVFGDAKRKLANGNHKI